MIEQLPNEQAQALIPELVQTFYDDSDLTDQNVEELRWCELTIKTAAIPFNVDNGDGTATSETIRVWTIQPDHNSYMFGIPYVYEGGTFVWWNHVSSIDERTENTMDEDVSDMVNDAPNCQTFTHISVTRWQRHELRDQTWLNIGTNGGATIKQIQDGDQVVIYLSAAQVVELAQLLATVNNAVNV